jgi:hypothetical protein
VNLRSETDSHGVVCESLDVGAKVTLKGRRRRYHPGQPAPLDTLPEAWRALLVRWVKSGERRKWETLLKEAGQKHVETAYTLLDWLLRGAWASVEEIRVATLWKPMWVEFREYAALRKALELSDDDAIAKTWLEAQNHRFGDPALEAAAHALVTLPPARAVARHGLLTALEIWREDNRSGTRRDFAQTARGDTKAISAAEWDWLETLLDLPAWGVERHAPVLRLRAPLVLNTSGGAIDLAAAPDFIALSADTIAAAVSIQGEIGSWRMVENRTSFERAARQYGANDAVVWLPGFAPSWWKSAMATLLRFAPAPALFACDPDPAGIEIALDAGEIWRAAEIGWQPWKMSPANLAALPQRKPLTERDQQRLAALSIRPLPAPLGELVEWMRDHDEKGEQEGLL